MPLSIIKYRQNFAAFVCVPKHAYKNGKFILEKIMKLKTGQSVKVKNGILCPDRPEYDLSSCHGRIAGIEEEEDENGEILIDIDWDSVTLNEMPVWYIEECEEEGLEWASMCLYASEVEPAEPRDSEKDVSLTRSELQKRFVWSGMGEDGKRIQAVINSADFDDDLEMTDAWEKYLRQHLMFPFDSVVTEFQGRGPFRQGDRLKVIGIETVEDLYGVIVSCRSERKKYHFPLADLAAVDKKSDNARHIKSYRIWFANR